MSNDTLRARIRLALGGEVRVGDRLPSADGSQRYAATRGREATTVTVFPRAPIGPTPEALRSMVDRFRAAQHSSLAVPRTATEVDGRACLVVPQPTGPTLADRLVRPAPIPVPEAIAILRDVARALASLHRRGLTHGSLEPAAVYLTDRGAVLAGLGASSEGTVRADLDALGRVAYALLAGVAPADPPLPLARHRRALPPEMHRLIDGMVATDQANRPTRAESVLESLDAVRARHPMLVTSFLDGATHGARVPRSNPIRLLIAMAGLMLVAWLVSGG